MTCVIALKVGDGRIVMGADSAAASGNYLRTGHGRKMYLNGTFAFGFTSSFRMGQLLGYSLVIPARPQGMDLERYMATLFIDAVRTTLKDGGWASKDKEQESGGTFLAVHDGHIHRVDSDYQVSESTEPWDVVGCGEDLATASLWTTGELQAVEPYNDPLAAAIMRVSFALRVAERYSTGVRGPFDIIQLGESKQ